MTQKEGTPKVQVAAAADSESRAPLKTIRGFGVQAVRRVGDGVEELPDRRCAGLGWWKGWSVENSTVNSHLRHIFAKLGIRSRVELARLAGERVTAPGS